MHIAIRLYKHIICARFKFNDRLELFGLHYVSFRGLTPGAHLLLARTDV